MNVKYFAWVREKIGIPEENVSLPDTVTTISDLITWLESRGPEYKAAFENRASIRAAINQTHVDHQTPLESAAEVAFFPPVTGG
jgi:molybdopterin synthase sulfur carrier subunit